MALDGGRRAANRHGFDHVGVERPLRQEIEVAECRRRVIEDVDEGSADDLALLLGVGHAREPIEKRRARINMVNGQLQLLVAFHHLPCLIQPEQAVVHENTLQSITDGAMDQRGRNG
jgi:hypothetical protein